MGSNINTYNPSAGTGRQGELKIRWRIVVNVQVVFRISNNYIILLSSFFMKIGEGLPPPSQE